MTNLASDRALSTIETAWYGERPQQAETVVEGTNLVAVNDAPTSHWSFRPRGCAEYDRRASARATYGYAYAGMAASNDAQGYSKVA